MKQILFHFAFFTLSLALTSPAHADYADKIIKGKILEETTCFLCAGRILCGGVQEVAKLNYIDGNKNLSVQDHCYLKTRSTQTTLQKKSDQLSREQERFKFLYPFLEKISQQKSTANIAKDKLQTRVDYRVKNGFTYKDLREAATATELKRLEQANWVVPILSYENFGQVQAASKPLYTSYIEALILTEPEFLFREENGLVHSTGYLNKVADKQSPISYQRQYMAAHSQAPSQRGVASIGERASSPSRGIASVPSAYTESPNAITQVRSFEPGKKTKSHNYYQTTDVENFVRKLTLDSQEYCAKLAYREVKAATKESILNLVRRYGGDSELEQSLHAKQLQTEVENAADQSTAECQQSLKKVFETMVLQLPNPTVREVENFLKNVPKRETSSDSDSSGTKGAIFCETDPNTMQKKCR